MAIQFRFNQRKATQAAAFMIEQAGGRLNYTKLIKLLYLAERESLHRRNRPISGDDYAAMPLGLVLSNTLNLIRGIHWGGIQHDYWKSCIEKSHNSVSLKTNLELGDLSDVEIRVLSSVFEEHKNKSSQQLIDFTHSLPEWHDPHGSSCSIPVEHILAVLEKKDGEVAEIEQYSTEMNYYEDLIEQLSDVKDPGSAGPSAC